MKRQSKKDKSMIINNIQSMNDKPSIDTEDELTLAYLQYYGAESRAFKVAKAAYVAAIAFNQGTVSSYLESRIKGA